ncbi:MAG: hypothetical protein HQL69_19155 [Magnetococcales bacterium]|nr:hypothetical protein [Magnetococcales bacterium]
MQTTILLLLLQFVLLSCSSTQIIKDKKGVKHEVSCQPIYGNWCGKSYPAYEITGIKPKPVDVWDAACRDHDLCYEKFGSTGEKYCDSKFANQLEILDMEGIPAPHQMINAYNYFKKHKPYRQFFVTFDDLWDASNVDCRGNQGLPTLFCNVGRGRDNCEISMGYKGKGVTCSCTYPNIQGPYGWIPGGTLYGRQKIADDF